MVGLIRTKHLVVHAPLIVRMFGWRAYFRCLARVLRHPGSATFLGSIQ
ncbi:MAG TPA: hypothetical protein VI072_16195 [Polyangiaceae bacterium]|jgi:hypothetical protein